MILSSFAQANQGIEGGDGASRFITNWLTSTSDGLYQIHSRYSASRQECQLVAQNIKDIYEGGAVGGMDRILSDGRLATPRIACDSLAPQQPIDYKIISNEIRDRSRYAVSNILPASVCSSDIRSQVPDLPTFSVDTGWIESYSIVDLTRKIDRFENALIALINAREILAMLNPRELPNAPCEFFTSTRVAAACQAMVPCQTRTRTDLFHLFSMQLLNDLERIRQHNDQLAWFDKHRNVRSDLRFRLQASRDLIFINSPILRGQFLEKYSKPGAKTDGIEISQFDSDLVEQLSYQQSEIEKRIASIANSYECLLGRSTGCANFKSDELSVRNAGIESNEVLASKDLARLEAFHTCVESTAEYRNEANSILNDVFASGAIALTPIAAINSVRLAAGISRFGLSVPRANSLITNIQAASLAGDSIFIGHQALQSLRSCQDVSRSIAQITQSWRLNQIQSQSCEERAKDLLVSNNLRECASELMMTGMGLGVIGLQVKGLLASGQFARSNLSKNTHYVPVPKPRTVSSQRALQDTDRIKKLLTEANIQFSEDPRHTYLGAHLIGAPDSPPFTVVPAQNGESFLGRLFKIEKSLGPHLKPRADVPILRHPELNAYIEKLANIKDGSGRGYSLVVDTSLYQTNTVAYYYEGQRVIGIRPTAHWAAFLHEFQHLEFMEYFLKSPHISMINEALEQGKNLLSALPHEVIEAIGRPTLLKIQKLLDRGFSDPNSINESLAVMREFEALGWRQYLPFHHGSSSYRYMLRHQISDLESLNDPLHHRGELQKLKDLYELSLIYDAFGKRPVPQVILFSGLWMGAMGLGSWGFDMKYRVVYYDEKGHALGLRNDGIWEYIERID